MTEEDLDRRSDWESSYAMEHKVLPWHEALYASWRLTAWQLRRSPEFAEQLAGKGGTEDCDAVVGLLAVRIWEAAYRAELLQVTDALLSRAGAVDPEAVSAVLAAPAPVESDEDWWRRLAEGHLSQDWAPLRLAVGEVLNAHLHRAAETGNLDPTVQARLTECPTPTTDDISALATAQQRATETTRLLASPEN
jgi:hypothetical protein